MAFAGIPTTYAHYSTGATLVQYDALALGYAEDRIMIDERPQWENVQNDAFGGGASVPSDVQYLGSIAYITCTLNRINEANIRALSMIEPDGLSAGYGEMPPMGRFMRQDSMYATLELINVSYTLNYPRAFLRQGRRFNVGVRHQQVILMFECHINDPCDMILFSYEDPDDPCS